MKSCNIKYWMQFGAVTAITAAITAALLNIGAAFAADVSTDSLKFGPNVVKAPGYQTPATTYIVGSTKIGKACCLSRGMHRKI